MTVIDVPSPRAEIVNPVNELIKRSFGRFWKGNLDFEVSSSTLNDPPYTLNSLCDIGSIVPGFSPILFTNRAGRFYPENPEDKTDNGLSRIDGSILVALNKYEKQALAYADIYSKEFGKEPLVIFYENVVDQFDLVRGAVKSFRD